ncbi:16S rRNA (uracil1498-N3)-methyltransferase [Geoalkalibacter ferrihydriticus]|uniref:Ribosomal RNA small subunit methyltransferase E n=1 Tax=Geoalkalibacter ferrihydriticus TaxID=392333 RepID=A0A1G9TKU0_9BACT|nr:16S rRNA (uracil(1498)-N(3))-methyltransferase [Geoalkalibacter ferrihydriticus]SDM48337.1 16S rRNA (uracil1498-N3)-methyltransferase [Geoalkalibacter ferrihydriticus]
MRRFFVNPEQLAGDEVILDGEIQHHLARVLRLVPKDEIDLLDGQGLCCRCRIEELTKKGVRLRVITRIPARERAFPIRLIQGLPKADKMDLILQKGTELGVVAFTPLLAERSVPRLEPERRQRRGQRWEKIILEAAQQSRRAILPRLDAPQPLAEALRGGEDLRLLLWEQESRPLAEVLPPRMPRAAAVLIGPEGGLAAAEVEQARAAGFVPVNFGPRILRTETAGFAVVTVLQYLYGDLGPATNADRGIPAPKEAL